MQYVTFLILKFLIRCTAILPFTIIYVLSDILSFFIKNILRYRVSVVDSNLQNSFPDFAKSDIRKIRNQFYQNFCDMILESIKGFYLSEPAILQRVKYLEPDLFTNLLKSNQPVMILMGHFLNWEWILMSLPLQIRNKVIILYKKVNNPYLNTFLTQKRERFGSTMAFIDETRQYFERFAPSNAVFVLGADQSPTNLKSAAWENFMHQETAFIHGPEKYALKYDMELYYLRVSKLKRGYFQVSLNKIDKTDNTFESSTIIQKYKNLLEEDIRRDPANWLWTHRRWKRKRSELSKNLFIDERYEAP